MRLWGVDVLLDLRLHQVVVNQGMYIHLVCTLVFCECYCQNLVFSAVATFFPGRLLSLERCVRVRLSLHGGLAVRFCYQCRMELHHWTVEGSVLWYSHCRAQDI